MAHSNSASTDLIYLRKIAVQCLSQIRNQDTTLKQLISHINPQHRPWVRDTVAGTLRWDGRIDLILTQLSKKTKPKGSLGDYIGTGIYQILNQETIAHEKIVSECVESIKKYEGDAQSRFANALLRQVVLERHEWNTERPLRDLKATDLVQWLSLSPFIYQKLKKDYDLDWIYSFAYSSLRRPSLWLRMIHPRGPSPQLSCRPGPVSRSFEVIESKDGTESLDFRNGNYFVQDISSQVLIHEVSKILPKESHLLDLCAAPGGKTMGMALNGYRVTASDFNERRVDQLRDNLLRISSQNTQIIPYEDALRNQLWDAVWIDAPCSGTGTLQKNPEIRCQLNQEKLNSLLKLQNELIKGVTENVRVDGYLIYSVCSILKDEGEKHIKRLAQHWTLIHSWLLTPHLAPYGEGFYAAILKRKDKAN